MTPLSLERLAVRIERLVQTRTHAWDTGDSMEFTRQLPASRVGPRFRLPSPQMLRTQAKVMRSGEKSEFTRLEFRAALQRCLRMESLISRNRLEKRALRDLQRGRPIRR